MFIDKKKKKTGEGGAAALGFAPREQNNSYFRQLGSWKAGEYK